MNVFAWILGIVLVGLFGAAGVSKVAGVGDDRFRLGYTRRQWLLIGLSEIAGAAGVVVGLIWRKVEWLGIAAAVGLSCVALGALMAHARVGDDSKRIVPALVALIIAAVYIVALALR